MNSDNLVDHLARVVSFSPLMQATDFARRTHQALEAYRDGLA